MNDFTMKPEPNLKELWYFINNALFLLALLVACIFISLSIVPILLAIWVLVINLPFMLYIPAFYRSLEYTLDNESIRMSKGVFWRRRTTVPFSKITNIDITQGPVERMFKIYDLQIQTAGSSGNQTVKAELVMMGIKDGEAVKEMIMDRLRNKPKPGEAVPVVAQSDKELLQAMLQELTAIREELAKPRP